MPLASTTRCVESPIVESVADADTFALDVWAPAPRRGRCAARVEPEPGARRQRVHRRRQSHRGRGAGRGRRERPRPGAARPRAARRRRRRGVRAHGAPPPARAGDRRSRHGREEVDVVLGLEMGAVDYVVKPFRLAELLARVRCPPAHRRVPPRPSGDGAGRPRDARDRRRHDRPRRRAGCTSATRRSRCGPRSSTCSTASPATPARWSTREQLIDDVWDENWWGSTKTLDVHINAHAAQARRAAGRRRAASPRSAASATASTACSRDAGDEA